MERKRPGQGGRGKPEGNRRPKGNDASRGERPERRNKPGEKPWEERKTRRGEGRPERPERRTGRQDGPDSARRPSREDGAGFEKKPRREDSTGTDRRPRREDSAGPERRPRREDGPRPERRAGRDNSPRPERRQSRDDGPRPERRQSRDDGPRPERRPGRDEGSRTERGPGRSEGRPERPERREKPGAKPWKERKPGEYGKSKEYSKPREYGKSREYGKPRDYGKPKNGRKSAGKDDLIRLNKYIANAGVSSRREADKLILAGVVRVNGKVVTELGTKISPTDKVQYEEQTISTERTRYILLNKPKGYITTVDDPEKRKTVMSLIEGAVKERVYPVGRLDRNTTGLLLFTNDGTIAKKLTHPRYGIKKIYHVELERSLSKADMEKIKAGLELEDGLVQVDKIEYIEDSKSKKELGVELHSGKNRVIRRIFEHLDYKVVKLDRVYYAGLTKKNIPRGHWRLLDEQEINMLKMISSGSK